MGSSCSVLTSASSRTFYLGFQPGRLWSIVTEYHPSRRSIESSRRIARGRRCIARTIWKVCNVKAQYQAMSGGPSQDGKRKRKRRREGRRRGDLQEGEVVPCMWREPVLIPSHMVMATRDRQQHFPGCLIKHCNEALPGPNHGQGKSHQARVRR